MGILSCTVVSRFLTVMDLSVSLSKSYVKHKGVVKEREFHKKALENMVDFIKNFKVNIEGIIFSKIKGKDGNIEFWIYLKKSINSNKYKINYDKIIDNAVCEAHLFFNKNRQL